MVVGRILQLLRWIFCVGVFVVVLSVAVVREFVMFGILISVKVMIYVEVLCCVSRCVFGVCRLCWLRSVCDQVWAGYSGLFWDVCVWLRLIFWVAGLLDVVRSVGFLGGSRSVNLVGVGLCFLSLLFWLLELRRCVCFA